ncbi:Gypsy retrotransposon integrase-like protein 1 [Dissostichus eleginoides]|uniref:Gypsy retrotransposon integrase-like protein 1 n=1 Tax=Dissostichus eleginoides TaxID=100907 RepID=A0AAD9F3X8_DISEL|nr:Gypsy retrotransposon integrase-like protein 1 [Dissostichus eleginoides]
MSQQAKGEWEHAFAVCQKVSQTDSSDGPVGVARLTRHESLVVPPNSEMVLWTKLYWAETKSDFCALVEGPERDDEWQVARTVAWVVKGRLPIRVCNPNPYPVTIPQRRSLANVFQVEPSQIWGEKDLVLKTSDPGVVEVDVQEGDQALVQVKEWVARGHFPLPEERKASQPAVKRLLREWSRLYIQEGVLKRRTQERHTGLNLSQIVVPTGKTQELWEKYHQASGHMGIAKIDALLRKTFYWVGMGTDLQTWASNCVSCTQQKKGPELLPAHRRDRTGSVPSCSSSSPRRRSDRNGPFLLLLTSPQIGPERTPPASRRERTSAVPPPVGWTRPSLTIGCNA